MSKLTLNVSKAEFENRVVAAIEGAMQSPLSKKKNKVLNAAMVQILHGGNGAGQNEHNLDMFWSEEDSKLSKDLWVVADNYRLESSDDEFLSVYTSITKEGALHNMMKSTIEFLSYDLGHSINLDDLCTAVIDNGLVFFDEFDSEDSCDIDNLVAPEQIDSFLLNIASTGSHKLLSVVFDYVTGLSCIEGTHTTNFIEQAAPAQPAQPAQPAPITIHTIIITDTTDDEKIVTCESTTSAEKHDQRLIELFLSHADENASFDKEDLIAHSVTQSIMDENDLAEEDMEEMVYDEIIEWLTENGRPNQIIEMITDMNYGLIDIEVQYENE
jgi:hypothetical protein